SNEGMRHPCPICGALPAQPAYRHSPDRTTWPFDLGAASIHEGGERSCELHHLDRQVALVLMLDLIPIALGSDLADVPLFGINDQPHRSHTSRGQPHRFPGSFLETIGPVVYANVSCPRVF